MRIRPRARGGRRGHRDGGLRVQHDHPAGCGADALSGRDVRREYDEGRSLRQRDRPAGRPRGPHDGRLRAAWRHQHRTPGDRVGARRQLLQRRQDRSRDRRRGDRHGHQGLRQRLDQLPPLRPGVLGGRRRRSVRVPAGDADAQHDAQAAVLPPQSAAAYRIDSDRIAIGGTSAGAITALAWVPTPTTRATAATPATRPTYGEPFPCRAPSCSGPRKALVTPQACCSTAAPTSSFRTRWPSARIARPRAAGSVSYLTTFPGEGHVPFNHAEQIIAETTNFLYWMLHLQHTSG